MELIIIPKNSFNKKIIGIKKEVQIRLKDYTKMY